MLRITVHDDSESLTFRLEGKLTGTWVSELRECWQRAFAIRKKSAVRFDLTEVIFVDQAGKALLSDAHAQGVELVASGCLMRAVVAELTNAGYSNCGCSVPKKCNPKRQRGGNRAGKPRRLGASR